ncbi:MAG: alpha/beta hydrolase-fold protein [Pseudomonadota bacterium]
MRSKSQSKNGLILVALLTFCASACAAPPPTSRPADGPGAGGPPPNLPPSLATEKTLQSKTLDRAVTFHLYLPPGYEASGERYPTVYWLHGSNGNSAMASRIVSGLFHRAMVSGNIPPAIVVFPDGMRQSMWVDSADGRVRMESFLVNDLLPHIDSAYRTRATPDARVVEGGSMGGYGAARLGLKYPERFGAVSMLSAGPLQPVLDPENAPIVGRKNAQQVLDTVYNGDPDVFHAQSP